MQLSFAQKMKFTDVFPRLALLLPIICSASTNIRHLRSQRVPRLSQDVIHEKDNSIVTNGNILFLENELLEDIEMDFFLTSEMSMVYHDDDVTNPTAPTGFTNEIQTNHISNSSTNSSSSGIIDLIPSKNNSLSPSPTYMFHHAEGAKSGSPSVTSIGSSTSATPTNVPTEDQSSDSSKNPSLSPSVSSSVPETQEKSLHPSVFYTNFPSDSPSTLPSHLTSTSSSPSIAAATSVAPTVAPTILDKRNICQIDKTMDERAYRIYNSLLPLSDNLSLVDEVTSTQTQSPQQLAFDFIVYHDERKSICLSDEELKQRYIIVVFYYSTQGFHWKECKHTIDTPCSGKYGYTEERYLSAAHECRWFGNTCDDDDYVITSINLENNGLDGTIPNEIFELTSLRNFNMDENKLHGKIPTEIGNVRSLQELDLDSNELSGQIPEELFSLSQLHTLDLNFNFFSGTLNSEIGLMTSLVFVQLDDNNFIGQIPREFGKLESLETLTFSGNDLKGNMDPLICELRDKNLINLWADCGGENPPISCPEGCCTLCF